MSVECTHRENTYSLGIKYTTQPWVWRDNAWRKLRQHDIDSGWYDEYEIGTADTSGLLESWVQYIPGVHTWDDYGDFSVSIYMNDMEAEGWTEDHLTNVLERMATHVNKCSVLKAVDEPYLYHGKDIYGKPYEYWRHPALEPLSGMTHLDYPTNISPV